VTRDDSERSYVEITARMRITANIGAFAIIVMVLAACATSWTRFGLAVVLNFAVFAVNLAFDKIVVRFGSREAVLRATFNGLACAFIYGCIDWPLPVWFWLPFVALTQDQAGRRSLHALLILCGLEGTAALLEGVSWVYPVTFTGFAVLCWHLAGARLAIIRSMLESAERQRDELMLAHDKLLTEAGARERVEVELRHAQKLESLGRLASGVAHEINTPMQFIGDSIEFVRDGVDRLLSAEADEDREYLAEHLPNALSLASDGCRRVATIVHSMKQFAHVGGDRVSSDLNAAVDATLTIASHEYKRVADVERDFGALPRVTCNIGELNQVFLNLITNAADAIESRAGERGKITVSTCVDERGVVVAIRDNGSGIPVEIRDHIFEPFFTTKEVGRGTGQGLSISRAVVERHGGKLTFETEVGRGTTFYVVLPLPELRAAA
jgi:signal transduction histidine kinase